MWHGIIKQTLAPIKSACGVDSAVNYNGRMHLVLLTLSVDMRYNRHALLQRSDRFIYYNESFLIYHVILLQCRYRICMQIVNRNVSIMAAGWTFSIPSLVIGPGNLKNLSQAQTDLI